MTQPYIPKFLEEAFDNGFAHTDGTKNKYEFYTFEIGQLKIIDGKIICL